MPFQQTKCWSVALLVIWDCRGHRSVTVLPWCKASSHKDQLHLNETLLLSLLKRTLKRHLLKQQDIILVTYKGIVAWHKQKMYWLHSTDLFLPKDYWHWPRCKHSTTSPHPEPLFPEQWATISIYNLFLASMFWPEGLHSLEHLKNE